MTDMLAALDAIDGFDPHRGQWRLTGMQVANWGTFDGQIYTIPISRKGHLITGPSGSGKSSLLDAYAAIMTPDKWLRFNAAAQGAAARDDDRGRMSYVRGAWSRTTDEFEDRVVSAYLRPTATWSGILLRYENQVDRPVTLCRLFFAKGTSLAKDDLSDLCLIERGDINLRDLEPFAQGGIEARKVQAQWPDAVVTTTNKHQRFYARMRSLLGIPQEEALHLLHKTQSAKSLESLDQLFRDFMLEKPATFDLATNAVEQFGELRDTHDHVVQLRKQRDHLLQLRAASEAFDAAADAASAARTLGDAVDPYRRRRMLDLARGERLTLDEQLIGQRADAAAATAAAKRAADDYNVAQRRTIEVGGGDVQHLKHRISAARDLVQQTEARFERFAERLRTVGINDTPTDASGFAELQMQITRMLEVGAEAPGATWEQQSVASEARRRVEKLEAALAALDTGSTVPGDLLLVRRLLCKATGLSVAALPFAGELIDVRPEFDAWTGAIERVLRPLALTMLVRSEHLAKVRQWVDAHPVEAHLVYEEVSPVAPPARPARTPISLVNRVMVAEGQYRAWLAGALSERYDVACVDSPDHMDAHVRAVTINGQIKTSRTRYEKDDRFELDNRARWVLGNHEAKRAALESQLAEAREARTAAEAVVTAAVKLRDDAMTRIATLKSVHEFTWEELDTAVVRADLDGLERNLHELAERNSDVSAAAAHEQKALEARDEAEELSREADLQLRRSEERHRELGMVIDSFERELKEGLIPTIDPTVAKELDQRFSAVQRHITRSDITDIAQKVGAALIGERDRAMDAQTNAGNEITKLVTTFTDHWLAASTAADLVPNIGGRRGYLDLLDQIEAHGLPNYEAKFLELLRERSRALIGDLVNDILGAPREIEERVLPINHSLRRSLFDDERFLKLRVKTRRSDTVARFIKDLQSISAGSWAEDDLDSAERRFETLAELMRRFASSDHVDKSWRTQCLDTRLHVTFLAQEIDEHDRVHATYDSAAAMSGGQQQKLVVFCLAAALRYRLADTDDVRTTFGTIVLDEAFDKADTRYTRMALDVFVEFGFQLILATPHKLLKTIEEYVGAATQIENPTRRQSLIRDVQWSEAPA